MRTLMKISIPVESGNTAIREGGLPVVLEQTLDRLKPEAAYFFADQGRRSALVVFDLTDPSEIPVIAEPLFMGVNTAGEFLPVMNSEDLRKGIGSLGASASANAPATARRQPLRPDGAARGVRLRAAGCAAAMTRGPSGLVQAAQVLVCPRPENGAPDDRRERLADEVAK